MPAFRIYNMSVLGSFPHSLCRLSIDQKAWQTRYSMGKSSEASSIEIRLIAEEAHQITSDCQSKLSSEHSHFEISNPENSYLRPRNANCRTNEIYRSCSNQNMYKAERWRTSRDEVIGDAYNFSTFHFIICDHSIFKFGFFGGTSSLFDLQFIEDFVQLPPVPAFKMYNMSVLGSFPHYLCQLRDNQKARQRRDSMGKSSEASNIEIRLIAEEAHQITRFCQSKLSSTLSHIPENSYLHPPIANYRTSEIYRSCSNQNMYKAERWGASRDEVIGDGYNFSTYQFIKCDHSIFKFNILGVSSNLFDPQFIEAVKFYPKNI